MRTPAGRPSRATTTAGLRSRGRRRPCRPCLAISTAGSGGSIAPATSSSMAPLVQEDALEQPALPDRADDVREGLGRRVADDRDLRDAVALHELDGLVRPSGGTRSSTSSGSRALRALERQHLLDRRLGRVPLQEPVLEEPVVVVDLREVAAAAVGNQRDDRRVGAEARGHLQHRPDGGAARAADEHALFARQAPGSAERVPVGHRDVLVDQRGIVGFGQKSSPIPSTRYGWTSSGRVDRAFRVGADDEEVGLLLLQVASRAADRPARARRKTTIASSSPPVWSQSSGPSSRSGPRDSPGSSTGPACTRPGSPPPGGRRRSSSSRATRARPQSGR